MHKEICVETIFQSEFRWCEGKERRVEERIRHLITYYYYNYTAYSWRMRRL